MRAAAVRGRRPASRHPADRHAASRAACRSTNHPGTRAVRPAARRGCSQRRRCRPDDRSRRPAPARAPCSRRCPAPPRRSVTPPARRSTCRAAIVRLDDRALGQAEVENLHLPVVQDEDVLRLEIAMDDAACSAPRRARARSASRSRSPSATTAAAVRAGRAASGPRAAPSRRSATPSCAAEIVNGEDVRMGERGDGARFALEPREAIGVGADSAAAGP